MKNPLLSIYHHPLKLFLCCWMITMLLYGLSFKAGIYEDILNYIGLYRELGFWEYINFQPHSLYQGYFSFLYFMTALFGTKAIFWSLVHTALHALTVTYAYRFFVLLYRSMGWQHPQRLLFLACMLFLITPLATEVVIWKACGHYFISTLFLLFILRHSLLFIRRPHSRHPLLIAIVYFISIFFLETFYLVPLMLLLLLIALVVADKISRRPFRLGLKRLFLPIAIIFGIYFVLLKATTGNWVGHGNGNLLNALLPAPVLENFNNYFARIFLMEYFFPHAYRQMIYKLAGHPVALVLSGMACLALIISFFNLKLFSNKLKTILVMLGLGMACCVLILPTWFYRDTAYIGSRYFYLPALFLLPAAISSLAYFIRSAPLKSILFVLYTGISIAATGIIVYRAYAATRVYNELIYNYTYHAADTVVLLNLPVMYKGYTMIPSGDPSNFNDHLKILTGSTAKGLIYDVAGYNMQTSADGAHILVMDSLRIKVAPNHYGSWWWNKTFGAYNYENSLYRLTTIDEGFRYILELKRKPGKGTVFLYQSGRQWKQVDLSQINTWQW